MQRDGNGITCVPYDDSCENGTPVDEAKRFADGQCKDCNANYGYANKKCTPCAEGHYADADHLSCTPFAGHCEKGTLIEQNQRTQRNHCGSCEAGYMLDNKVCTVQWGGTCADGHLITSLASRTADDQCGSCKAGFKLVSTKCEACGTNEYQPTNQFTGGTCTPCIFDICDAGHRLHGQCGHDSDDLNCLACDDDEWLGVLSAGAKHRSRVCEVCPNFGDTCNSTEYMEGTSCDKATGTGYTCKSCTSHPSATCEAGYRLSGTCGQSTSNSECTPCGKDTFISGGQHTHRTCTKCIVCGVYEARVGTSCSSTTGTGYECLEIPGTCPPGYERTGPTSVNTSAQLTNACKACTVPSYKNGTNNDPCNTCTTCGAGKYESVGCSGTADTVCATCSNSNCPNGKHRSGSCSGSTNGYQCTPCSHRNCPSGQYRSGSCSKTTNGYKCNTCATCGSGTAKSGCTGTSDTVCLPTTATTAQQTTIAGLGLGLGLGAAPTSAADDSMAPGTIAGIAVAALAVPPAVYYAAKAFRTYLFTRRQDDAVRDTRQNLL